MNNDALQNSSRRKFLNNLAVGSLAGLVAGSVAHAAEDEKKDLPIILQDPNVCCGLNTCKGIGKGEHDCAGQSQCATAEAHTCSGTNACKGQGGCGAGAGQNECKGKGECAVPLMEKSWKKARAAFETAAKKNGIKVGPAPTKG